MNRKLSKCRKIAYIYENLWMLFSYIKTKFYAHRSKVLVTEQDKENIKYFKDMYKGKRCFIVGQGPSLTVEDLEKIKYEISFTVNNGPVAYDKTDWRASFYVVFDSLAISRINNILSRNHEYEGIFTYNIDNSDFKGPHKLRESEIGKKITFLPTDFSCTFCLDTFWDKYLGFLFDSCGFSRDISKIIYSGTTVVYTCLQIVAYMGFSEVYLLGVDCDYTGELKHASITMEEDELAYKREEWVRAERIQLGQFSKLAMKKKFDNFKIYNATRGGKLEAFERVNLDSVVNETYVDEVYKGDNQ